MNFFLEGKQVITAHARRQRVDPELDFLLDNCIHDVDHVRVVPLTPTTERIYLFISKLQCVPIYARHTDNHRGNPDI